jgi:hypothetical protein
MEEEFERNLRRRCEEQGEDFDQLMKDSQGDVDTVDSWLWAMSKD